MVLAGKPSAAAFAGSDGEVVPVGAGATDESERQELRGTLDATLELLRACESIRDAGVLSFRRAGDVSGELVLGFGKVCLVSAGGPWARRLRGNDPQAGALAQRLLERSRGMGQSFEAILDGAGEWTLERFRSALLEESARNLITLARGAVVAAAQLQEAAEATGWTTSWRPARPSYPENLAFSLYEMYEEVVRLLPELDSEVLSAPGRVFEDCRGDCRLALLVLSDPNDTRGPILLKAAGELSSLSQLCTLARCAARLTTAPTSPRRPGSGARYIAFGPTWNRCLAVSEGRHHAVLVSDEPDARARVAQRVFSRSRSARQVGM